MAKVIYITNYRGGNEVIMLDEERKKEIERRAKDIFLEYKLEIPVDPVVLASKVNIIVLKGAFKNLRGEEVLGAIKKENNMHRIIVNKTGHINRQRFTIAHELGHYFLGHMNDKKELVSLYRGSEYSNSRVEREADYFAGCILMNAEQLKTDYAIFKKLGYADEGMIRVLAQLFKVSKKAMEIRLEELNLITKKV